MDFPKIDKGAKVTMINIGQNFIGLISTFMLFRENINNTKKFIQLYKQYEFGLYSNSQIKSLNHEIFDSKITDKLLLLFSPDRTHNKLAFDCVDLHDGELMINSGVLNSGPKAKMFFCGGINSILPILQITQKIAL